MPFAILSLALLLPVPFDFETGVMEIPVVNGIDSGTLSLKELITLGPLDPIEDGETLGPVEPMEDGETGPRAGAGLFIFIGGGTNTVLT